MKARLLPLYFDPGRDADFDTQLAALRRLLPDSAEFLPPRALGRPVAAGEADAVIFPQILGQAYRRLADFRQIPLPILIVTTEFGTMSMWDWEIIEYLRGEGVQTIAPYDMGQTRKLIAAVGLRRELGQSRFLVFQDNPGEGAQPQIFKRFYWWEEECTRRIEAKFGLRIVRKSYRELCARAKAISDADADAAWAGREAPLADLGRRPVLGAVKLYLAIRRELDADPSIRGVGANCLNESHFSDTTPCLAWALLYRERKLTWGCEGDTLSMLTQHLLHRSLGMPILMSNLYPFLMGQAALSHEHIANFPQVAGRPEDHVLVAHCGYLGVMPREFASEWKLRKKVLAIVDDNAHAIDARLPAGPVTLAKLHPTMNKMTIAQGTLKGYAQFPGSDCVNGGVVEVRDGRRLVEQLASHHYLLSVGHHLADIGLVGKVFGIEIEEI